MTAPRPDADVLYTQLTTHIQTCLTCARESDGGAPCVRGHEILKAWGDASVLADRQAFELDTAFQLDDDYQAELGRS